MIISYIPSVSIVCTHFAVVNTLSFLNNKKKKGHCHYFRHLWFPFARGDIEYLMEYGISARKNFAAMTEIKIMFCRSLGDQGGLNKAPEC